MKTRIHAHPNGVAAAIGAGGISRRIAGAGEGEP